MLRFINSRYPDPRIFPLLFRSPFEWKRKTELAQSLFFNNRDLFSFVSDGGGMYTKTVCKKEKSTDELHFTHSHPFIHSQFTIHISSLYVVTFRSVIMWHTNFLRDDLCTYEFATLIFGCVNSFNASFSVYHWVIWFHWIESGANW